MELLIKLAFEALAIAIKQLKALDVSDEDIETRSKKFLGKVDSTVAKDRKKDLELMGQ